MLGLSNDISFVSVFFLEGGQKSQNIKLKNCLYRLTSASVHVFKTLSEIIFRLLLIALNRLVINPFFENKEDDIAILDRTTIIHGPVGILGDR